MCDSKYLIAAIVVLVIIIGYLWWKKRHLTGPYVQTPGSFLPSPTDTYTCGMNSKQAGMCLVPRKDAETLCNADPKCLGFIAPGRTVTAAALSSGQPIDMVNLVGVQPIDAATGPNTPGFDYYTKPK